MSDTELFADVDDVPARLREVGYLADEANATAVFLATRRAEAVYAAGKLGLV